MFRYLICITFLSYTSELYEKALHLAFKFFSITAKSDPIMTNSFHFCNQIAAKY